MRNNLNKIQWCPGCGDFAILASIKSALKELDIKSEDTVVVSGIGCSGKFSQYINGYGVEALHGRTLPFATGVKQANPDLTVIAISGDGDGYGIGLAHFINSCRRNINLLYIVADNENYALTTGQASATTPKGAKTKSTPEGNELNPLNPLELAKTAGCKFSYELESKDIKGVKEKIIEGIKYEGFSHLNIKQDCPGWRRW